MSDRDRYLYPLPHEEREDQWAEENRQEQGDRERSQPKKKGE